MTRRSTPNRQSAICDGSTLHYGQGSDERWVPLGSQAWLAWLREPANRGFAFRHPQGVFTARREARRGSDYWYAYRKQGDQVRKVYLGRAEDLTPARLTGAAATLAQPAPPPASPPAGDAPDAEAGEPHLIGLMHLGRLHLGQTTLVATKLFVPRPRADIVPRPRLLTRLDAGLAGAFTLVAAPAGSGKTTLLAAWLAQLARPVAWLTLDEGDQEPHQFLRYLVTALQTVVPACGATGLALLRLPQPPPLPSLLAALVNDLATLSAPCLLVLDDYHVVRTPAIHEAIAFLLDHALPQFHLVIATREDPPLPLARLRVRRLLREIRAADLQFTPEEASVFLCEIMGLPLTAAQVAALTARAEGWIAGLHLAALALERQPDPAAAIAAVTGTQRFILDYLIDEVLDRQPAAVQRFLLQTSILDRLCAPLCDAVVGLGEDESESMGARGDDDSAFLNPSSQPPAHSHSLALLVVIDRANLFLVPLDGERHWYRYHHLFGEVLRARLDQAQPWLAPVLYRRAAAWCGQEGLVAEAIRYARAGGAEEQMAGLVEQHAMPTMLHGDLATVRGWLNLLPDHLVRARPRLGIIQTLILLISQDFAAIEACLDATEQALATLTEPLGDMPAEVTALRGYGAMLQFDDARAQSLLTQALAVLPVDNPVGHLALFGLGSVHSDADDLAAADQALTTALARCRAAGNVPVALLAVDGLAFNQFLRGRLRRAAAAASEGLALAAANGTDLTTFAADLQETLARVHYERNELELARRHLQLAEQIARQGEYTGTAIAATAMRAQVQWVEGDAAGAWTAMAELEQYERRPATPAWAVTRITLQRVWFQLAEAESTAPAPAEALAWARHCGLAPDDSPTAEHERAYVLLARVLLLVPDRRADGLRLLARLLAAAEAAGRTQLVIAILAVRAVGLALAGERAEALVVLARALGLGEPEGFIRTFVDLGPPMAVLLTRLRASRRRSEMPANPAASPAYLARLLAAFPRIEGRGLRAESPAIHSVLSPQSSVLVEPLSARELEVLRLVAAGATNKEIARQLIMAEATVKAHLTHLYGKLDVPRRTEAVARARALGILP